MSELEFLNRPGVDFSRSGVSRYIQLATLFRRRIEQGIWPVGAQIPTVDDLATECSVARATVRQALDILEDDKLIKRYRAKGTFVIQQPQEQMWCEVPTDWSGLLLSPDGASIEVLDYDSKAQPVNIQHKVGERATEYRCWRRRHLRNGRPYYIGNAYIDECLIRKIPAEMLATHTTLRILKDLPDLKLIEVHQTITVGTADLETAEALEIPLNAPVVYCYRTAVDDKGKVVFVGDGVYRGDVVRLDVKVSVK
ncbi:MULTISPECIES: GntR family transcriptional regulator [unclassified Pseudomonas]|uniref:GntR family transcriptional regulator n=1 Tax=unclassified Pseudomonas TaxID=196821 RepID=UPI000BC38D73|nr:MULTISPECIES: GntR family transcriptional regulator [unclassified Pseudomonas]PVZ10514.1 GntR family transcriptional regulator [Pseudomonas sp. URIL14HWK12:I12]PVZ21940.1 GntR family transcriptional regulator [Pseudomonas sp. URIL14HWK12:I10]PVZ30977.1 GntR family transcriptional regulator [Pseudomonas sp. URIL14HWK12:I11]SNZ17463.1 GntR family transcriptional regulator [Pseudomonas sp. URIL14HWK12:I9]